jgi:hypothetical protein
MRTRCVPERYRHSPGTTDGRANLKGPELGISGPALRGLTAEGSPSGMLSVCWSYNSSLRPAYPYNVDNIFVDNFREFHPSAVLETVGSILPHGTLFAMAEQLLRFHACGSGRLLDSCSGLTPSLDGTRPAEGAGDG